MQSREYQLEIKEIIIFEHKIPNDRHRKNISCDFIENVEVHLNYLRTCILPGYSRRSRNSNYPRNTIG
jgi:hypothetical protein